MSGILTAVSGVLVGGAAPGVTRLITSFSGGTERDDFTGEAGFRFNVSSTKSLTDLSMRIGSTGSGNWTVNLYHITTGLTLSSLDATASVSRTGTPGNYNSTSITPFSLTTGVDWVLTFVTTASDGNPWLDNDVVLTIPGFMTIIDSGVATNVWIPTLPGTHAYGVVNGIVA